MIFKSETGTDAWDDLNNLLHMKAVQEARREEMTLMKEGKTFQGVKGAEAGKPPISISFVDTDKSHGVEDLHVRSRWDARGFKTRGAKDRRQATLSRTASRAT